MKNSETQLTSNVSSNKIGLNEQFSLTFIFNEKGEQLSPPNLINFSIISGPTTHLRTSIINGKITRENSYSYKLRAKKKGTFTIGPATIKYKGKSYVSQVSSIQVCSNRLADLLKATIIIGDHTYNNFITSYTKSKSNFSSATKLESQIFGLVLIDYFLHSHKISKEFISEFVNEGIGFLQMEDKDYDSKSNLIESRYHNYANILSKSDAKNWQQNLIEDLEQSLLATEHLNEIIADYPINLHLDFIEVMEGKMEFVKNQIGLLHLSNKIVNDVICEKESFDYIKSNKKKEGCYIATMVYGDYESEQVKVLRNFRDEKLQKHFLGRVFIKFYYFISPYFVKILSGKKLINNVIKFNLEIIVKLLRAYSKE